MRTARGNELESIHGPEKKYRLGGGKSEMLWRRKGIPPVWGHCYVGPTASSSALQARAGLGQSC